MAKSLPGFTLVEILIFLLLAAVFATTLLSSAGNYAKTKGVNSETIATKIASREIEALRNTDFDSLPQSGTISDPELSKLSSSSASRTISNYQSDLDIKQVIVSVFWTENNTPQNVTLETLITKNGL